MSGRSCRALAAAISVAVLPGCVLLDGHDELTIQPPGTLYGAEVVRLRVNGPCDEVSLEIDGEQLEGFYETNRDLVVPIALADGPHRFVARARDGALPGATVERRLEVDNSEFAVTSVTPTAGATLADRPFVVTFAVSKRLDPAFPLEVSLPWRSQRAASVFLSENLRTVTVSLDGPLEDLGEQSIGVMVRPAGGASQRYLLGGPWHPSVFTVQVSSPPSNVASTAPFRFTATATGDLPPAAELWAGEHLVSALGPPPWDLPFDASGLPDGSYALSVRAPGHYVHGTFPSIHVDSTVPRVIRCVPEASPPDEAAATECVEVAFSESVGPAPTEARLIVNGAPRATTASYFGDVLRLCPTDTLARQALPVVQTVTLPSLRDASGNPLAPLDCQMTLRPWRAIHGTTLAGIGANEVAFPDGSCELWSADLLAISPAGAPGGGTVRAWRRAASTGGTTPTFEVVTVLQGEPGSVAAQLGPTAWIERVGDGPGRVHTCALPADVALNADAGHDARAPASWTRWWTTIAWSEVEPAGGRRIRAMTEVWTDSWEALGASPPLSPGSVANEPAVAGGSVAWVEASPGGVPQLRAAYPSSSGDWTPLPSVGNVDPAAAAAEPALSADEASGRLFVAWREGGLVRAQLFRDGVSAAEPVVLNIDPAHRARTPKFSRIWLDLGFYADHYVYWVEDSPRGDEIWARYWNGSEWELLPGPVNADDAGTEVRSFDVHERSVVWADETGAVRLRAAGW